MTRSDEDRAVAGGAGPPAAGPIYPWHSSPPAESAGPPPGRPGIQGTRAGPVTRIVANVLDAGLVALVLVTGYVAVAGFSFLWRPATFRFPSPGFELVLILGAAVCIVYFTALWSLTGRTYGDAVLGVRIVDRHGEPLRLPRAALRAALCIAFPIGLLWVLVSAQNRSVQDVLLRTSVVHDWTVHR